MPAAIDRLVPRKPQKELAREMWPKFADVVHEVFGDVLTEAERVWIEFFEGMGMMPPPVDPQKHDKLQKILLAHDWEEEGEA